MRQNRQYQLYWLMCNCLSGLRFGLDIGVHNFIFSDMDWIWSRKKVLVGSGLQNFHICKPLVYRRGSVGVDSGRSLNDFRK